MQFFRKHFNSPQKTEKRYDAKFDFILLILTYILVIAGVLFVAVATYNPSLTADLPLMEKIMKSNTGSWQAIFMIASPIAMWIVVGIPYMNFRRIGKMLYGAVLILLLIAVASKGIRGVSSWIEVALGRMLQPAEFAKIALIIVLADAFTKTKKPLSTKRSVAEIFVIFLVPVLLTLAQGETGSVLVMAAIFFVMLFFSESDWKWWAGLLTIAVLGIGFLFALAFLSGSNNYRFFRILSFLDPIKYAGNEGLQVLNSQEAIGSGGLTGVGLFVVGSHSQLNFVPEDWTDFIFASIGEAVGFVGSATIVLVYFLLIVRMVFLAKYTKDDYGRLIIFGVIGMLFFHVFQNIAMTLGLMPITGIPLPFLSYGGSNLMTNIVAVSLVLNVTRNRIDAEMHYVMKIGETKIKNGLFVRIKKILSSVLKRRKFEAKDSDNS